MASSSNTASMDQAGSAHVWEEAENAWESAVQEDAQGRIIHSAGGTLADAIRQRRKRMEANDYFMSHKRVVRDMIRYVFIVLDVSRWMRQKDSVLPPGTMVDASVALLQEFVQDFFDQNPLSHLGIVTVQNGEAEILTQLCTSSAVHKIALQNVTQMVLSEGPHKGGEFSLQNGLEVAGRSLGHQPRHGSREVVVLTAALSTCDPGFVLTETLPKLQRAKVRVSCFALSAELHICRKLAEETSGTMGVCLDKPHFKQWLYGQCVPPPALHTSDKEMCCDMIQMGFPTRLSEEPSLVHASREKTIIARTAYACPQCQAKNSELPTDCAVCGLKLVLAPHLARSFHHLFPVQPFAERPMEHDTQVDGSPPVASSQALVARVALPVMSANGHHSSCYACLKTFVIASTLPSDETDQLDESLRFQCPDCSQYFCLDCDAFLHGTLHNCPGCLRRP